MLSSGLVWRSRAPWGLPLTPRCVVICAGTIRYQGEASVQHLRAVMSTATKLPSAAGLINFGKATALISLAFGGVALIRCCVSLLLAQPSPVPKSPSPPIEPLIIMILGAAFWLVLRVPAGSGWRLQFRIGQILAIVVAFSGVAVLAELLLGWNAGSGKHWIAECPSFPTGLCAVALGLGTALVEVRVFRLWLAEVLGVATLQIAMLALIGHLFLVSELYGSIDFQARGGMPLHSAAMFFLLGTALLGARPDRGVMAVLRSSTPGGTLARRWVLLPTLVLVVMGLVYLILFQSLKVPRALGSWALFMTCFSVLTAAVWATAEVLHQTGLERDDAQHTLEQRVCERTAQLTSVKEELARVNTDLEKTVQERTAHLNETIHSLETMCYNIAHDLRAPNRAISGFAEVLLAQHGASLPPTARDCLSRIATAAQHSDQLTLDLLAYGRLAHADVPCSAQDLRTHLTDVTEKMAREIAAADARIDLPNSLPNVWANPTVLQQVVTNLLSNALKFVPEGKAPRVAVRVEDAGAFWRVLVQDNGIGIPPEYQQRIFGVFQRLHAAGKYEGSGIGLAIVQKGIERMGGKVGVRSSDETGSCFWFELLKLQNGS